jgi:hypothetical protein
MIMMMMMMIGILSQYRSVTTRQGIRCTLKLNDERFVSCLHLLFLRFIAFVPLPLLEVLIKAA